MDTLRQSLLRQELRNEIEKAKSLERDGNMEDASKHYIKAGVIYRRIAFDSPREKAERMFDVANQYEKLGNTMKAGRKIEEVKDITPGLYDDVINTLIITHKPDTEWEHIGGLKDAKSTIKEAIILPFIHEKPPYVKATRTILLYGPPGTGKTLLAQASSNTLNATFFEARLPALLSKYYGESGKLINALFQKARKMSPSLIFMDELDSIAISREGDMNEATRRVLGQLLQEIEGFNTKKEEKVLIMGATNKPWDLDDAVISRFQKKIYVPLPDKIARKSIFNIHLEGAKLDVAVEDLANKTEGFSGRDIYNLCQEAINRMVMSMNPNLDSLTSVQIEKYTLKSRALTMADFEEAFKKIKPSVPVSDIKKYEDWKRDFGG